MPNFKTWSKKLPVVGSHCLFLLALYCEFYDYSGYYSRPGYYNSGLIWCFQLLYAYFLFILASHVVKPGSIPSTLEWRPTINIPLIFRPPRVYVKKRLEEHPPHWSKFELTLARLRFCSKCNAYKPDRTHHCSTCNTCVLGMDHHCYYMDTCIGYRNRKIYLHFLISIVFYCLMSFIRMVYVLVLALLKSFYLNSESDSIIYRSGWVILALFYFTITIVAGYIMVFQFILICKNQTMLEHQEPEDMKRRYMRVSWNRGLINNLKDALGQCPILWFLPLIVDGGDGMHYEPHYAEKEGPEDLIDANEAVFFDAQYGTVTQIVDESILCEDDGHFALIHP